MASQRRKNRTRPTSRSRQRAARQSGLGRYALLIGVVVIAVAVVAALAALDLGSSGSDAEPEAAAPDKSLGAPDAPVEVLEYADFQCPYCRQFAQGPEAQLKTEYVDTGQVRFVYRHYPFIGDESIWAAEAAECAEEQDRFWDYHDKLFAEQGGENTGAFSRDNLKQFAAELGLDTAQFKTCLDDEKYRADVLDERDEARRRRIPGTPALLVNGQLIDQGGDYQVLKAAIDAALAGQ
jgi:protein-disulfide isomerase